MRRKPVSDWTMEDLKQILERVRMSCGEDDYKIMNAVVETLSYLTHLAKDKQAAEIYRILGSSKSEKTRKILRVLQIESAAESDAANDPGQSEKPSGCVFRGKSSTHSDRKSSTIPGPSHPVIPTRKHPAFRREVIQFVAPCRNGG